MPVHVVSPPFELKGEFIVMVSFGIVVKAYYKSGNEKEGEGEITYRFMLGKDAALDFDIRPIFFASFHAMLVGSMPLG